MTITPSEAGLAGELDAMIAREIMGWHKYTLPRGDYWLRNDYQVAAHGRWSPTTNAYAFDRLLQAIRRPDTVLKLRYRPEENDWYCHFSAAGIGIDNTGSTMNLAACKAMYTWWTEEQEEHRK